MVVEVVTMTLMVMVNATRMEESLGRLVPKDPPDSGEDI